MPFLATVTVARVGKVEERKEEERREEEVPCQPMQQIIRIRFGTDPV